MQHSVNTKGPSTTLSIVVLQVELSKGLDFLFYSLLVLLKDMPRWSKLCDLEAKKTPPMKWPSPPTQEVQGEAIERGNLEKL